MPDTRWHGRSAPRAAMPVADGAENPQRQCAGKRLEVKWTIRTLFFGFFHQEPAQRFDTLIDRKKMVPRPFGNKLRKTHLSAESFEKA